MRVGWVTPSLADLGGGRNLLFVKVETEGGPHGRGECYTQADRDRSIIAHVEALGRYLVGRDAAHITHFVHMARMRSRHCPPGLGIELDEAALARFPRREFPARALPTPAHEGP